MIKVENIDVWGFEHAIRGMRNPLNSWSYSDSGKGCCHPTWNKSFVLCKDCNEDADICGCDGYFQIGSKDLDLMRRLYKAGTEHRKYLRQIVVSMDITAPLYWWKEFDTYKVGTTANSCSTMHKIQAKEFTINDFSCEHLLLSADATSLGFDVPFIPVDQAQEVRTSPNGLMNTIIAMLNKCRILYLETKNKVYWWQMIQMLPSSYNQRRTVTMNYENVMSMITQRNGHKLDEWNNFVDILLDLPYVKEIRGEAE